MQPTVLLVRFGEIHLKGQNRPYFINTLLKQIRNAVKDIGGTAIHEQSRIYVRGLSDIDEGAERVCRIFGVHSVSPVVETEKDYDTIRSASVAVMDGLQGTFKVLARRADKSFPMDSNEICRELGGDILDAYPAILNVDVHKPEHVLNVEVREKAYIYVKKIPAVGGMPVGTNGRAMLLLSGGIDSPVAGYMVAKRGVLINAIYFHSFPFTSEQAKRKVIRLARLLSAYCGTIHLHIVPFTHLQTELNEKCPDDYLTILMRRAMMRIAEAMAVKYDCSALVTGESVGQVASQTMASLAATDIVVNMPVFRPLIGFDKIEIIQRAHEIGTYETSILPYEDCCTIFTPRHPVTRPHINRAEDAEGLIDLDGLIAEALNAVETLRVTEDGKLEEEYEK